MKRKTRKKTTASTSVAELFPPPGRWTEDDYLALPDTNRYVELSEGRLVLPPHPTRRHQTVVERIFLEEKIGKDPGKDPRCKVTK